MSQISGMLGYKQAAAYIGVSRQTLNNWIKKKVRKLKKEAPTYYLMGGRFYFKTEDLDSWMERYKNKKV